jgi:DNA-binding SARP family transcriptional activator/tetratricopeptide (TPR) repeat protein
MLRLVTFGGLWLADDDQGRLPLPEKALLALVYLMAEQKAELPREHLARLLWSGDQEAAKTNFRKMIERVRKCAANGWRLPMEFSTSTVDLTGVPVDADFMLFSADLDPGEHLRSASNLLTLRFLDGVDLPSTLKLWAEKQRERHWNTLRDLFLRVSATALDRTDSILVKEVAKQLLERHPDDVVVQEVLMEAHRREGGATYPLAALPRDMDFSVSTDITISPVHVTRELPRLVLLAPLGIDDGASYPARALLEDITISLCSLRSVAVVAPYTAERIRSHPDKVSQLETHAISYVIDTRMGPDGLFVQMIFLPSDSLLWAERFHLDPNLLVSHRKQVAQMVVAAISNHLRLSETILADYRAQPEVYRSYLASSQHLNKFTLPDVRRARNAFRETLKMRSDFAPALAGLSRTYSWEWVLTARGDGELLRQAEQTAQRAVRLEPELASAHRELALSKLYIGDVDASLEAFDQAERLSPHLADAVCGYADALVHASKPAEGLAKIAKAMALNPICPDDYFWIAAGASYFLGRFDAAIGYIERMEDPSSARRLLAASHAMAGDMTKARMHRRKAQELNPYFDLEKWLSVLPVREQWQKDIYREGLLKAGF